MTKSTKATPKRRVVTQLGFTRAGLALLVRSLDIATESALLNDVDQNEAKALRERVRLAYVKLTSD